MKKSKKFKTEYGTISLPMSLIDIIKGKIKGTGISSVSAYVSFVLRQILSEPEKEKKEALSKEDEIGVRERLKTLGYL